MCTEDGGFEPLVCDKLACWNVDELTGERDFCSHANGMANTLFYSTFIVLSRFSLFVSDILTDDPVRLISGILSHLLI